MRLFIAACLAVLAACGGAPNLPPDAGAPPAPSFSCLQVLQCIVDCAETDAACPDACLGKGTAQAQSQTLELAGCIDTYTCGDAQCVTDHCNTELTTCVGGSVPEVGGAPPVGPTPPGSVPADMVGSWAGARYGITERLVFNADGTGSWTSSNVSSYYACLYVARTVRSGTVVVAEKLITVYASQVEERIHDCTGPDEVTQLPPVTAKIEWSRSSTPDEILIIDEKCAANYPDSQNCDYLGCPIGLYCTSRLKRE